MKCPIHNLEMHYHEPTNRHACQAQGCKYCNGVFERDIDPFAREKLIRSGELDDQIPGYQELTGWFQRVSVSQLPGLMISLIQVVALKKVFKDFESQAACCIRAIEQAGSYLRDEPSLEEKPK